MIRNRDLPRDDFPLTIVVHREHWTWENEHDWLWAVTVLPPSTAGSRVPLYVPPAREPAWVTTRTGKGEQFTTGPHE